MPKKKTAAPTGIGNGGSTQKNSTSTFNHATALAASLFVPIYDNGRFVSLRRFESLAAARVAMRQGLAG
ncbi:MULTISPECIES: hypothetical protein [unclassified Xanthobacter]|uniref:hypothetical protein n=1 Tax=unclassified Xanthobacter TaxID=2623496 RepID=UPI001F19254F|nr:MULTISPECIES: hypothetical protein [unclassified Xanthobacter]